MIILQLETYIINHLKKGEISWQNTENLHLKK